MWNKQYHRFNHKKSETSSLSYLIQSVVSLNLLTVRLGAAPVEAPEGMASYSRLLDTTTQKIAVTCVVQFLQLFTSVIAAGVAISTFKVASHILHIGGKLDSRTNVLRRRRYDTSWIKLADEPMHFPVPIAALAHVPVPIAAG